MEIAAGQGQSHSTAYDAGLWMGSDHERQLGDSSDPGYWDSAAFAPDAYPTLGDTTGYYDSEGFFDSIVHAVSSVGRAVGGAVSGAARGVASVAKAGYGLASQGTHLLQEGLHAISNNPLWNIVQTGASFIPGVGTAVSAGMAGAAAIGRGESLKNIALSATRNAIPGGPAVQAAFDAATGLIQGKNVTDAILQAARQQVPGGAAGQAAFDAAVAIGKGHSFNDVAIQQIRNAVPGGNVGKAVFDKAMTAYRQQKIPMTAPQFPGMPATARKVAQTIAMNPFQQGKTVRQLSSDLATAPSNIRSAIAALMNQWKGQQLYTAGDVGDFDSAESCCLREGISPGDTSGFYVAGPRRYAPMIRVALSRPHVQAMFNSGRPALRGQLLAHGFLARIAHNTGELGGDGGWIIRSGDSPFAIAQKLTGQGNRWREILTVNPSLKVTTKNGTTLVTPFNPGQRITIPTSWLGTAAPANVNIPPVVTVTPSSSGGGQGAGTPQISVTAQTLRSMPTIKVGSQGPAVSAWQAIVKQESPQIAVDGKFGPITQELTRLWQGRHKDDTGKPLVVDGVVGPKTWGAAAALMSGGAAPISLPPVPAPPATTPAKTPAVPSSADQVSLAAVQAMLASFMQFHHGEIGMGDFSSSSTPPYGSDPASDLAGVWTNRSIEAMTGFQNWRNAHPASGIPPLPETGQPDQISVNALQAQNAADLSQVSGVPIPGLPQLPTVPVKTPVPGSAPPATRPPAVPPSAPPKPTQAGVGGGSDLGMVLAIAALGLVGLSMAGKRAA